MSLSPRSISEKLAATEPPVHVSVTCIARALDGQLVTTKKLQDCSAQRNSARVKADRVAYAQWYLQHVDDAHVYVDETCFNLFTHRTRGRSKRGEPAFRQLRFERGRNLNLVMAVSPAAGIVYYELRNDTMNIRRFQDFLDNLQVVLEAFDADNNRTSILMDNAPVQRRFLRQCFCSLSTCLQSFFEPDRKLLCSSQVQNTGEAS